MSISICELCYKIERPACQESMTIEMGLAPSTEYTLFIRDKFDHDYTETITTDPDGSMIIDLTAFPEGMFTEFSGSYELSVSTNDLYSTHEAITISGTEYLCVIIDFIKVN